VFALSVTTSVCTFVAQGIVFVTLPFIFKRHSAAPKSPPGF
jgi:hypothetical protein